MSKMFKDKYCYIYWRQIWNFFVQNFVIETKLFLYVVVIVKHIERIIVNSMSLNTICAELF